MYLKPHNKFSHLTVLGRRAQSLHKTITHMLKSPHKIPISQISPLVTEYLDIKNEFHKNPKIHPVFSSNDTDKILIHLNTQIIALMSKIESKIQNQFKPSI